MAFAIELSEWRRWRHITKIDPDRPLNREIIEAVSRSGTDAIMVSGTLNVTREKVINTIKAFEKLGIPLVLEPAAPEAVVTEGVDYLFIPTVVNAGDTTWITGAHARWFSQLFVSNTLSRISWDRMIPEGYIVMNPESAVAKLTKSRTDLTIEEVVGYALTADRYLKLPAIYLEYSGAYGDVRLVSRVREILQNSHLIYGGGIDSREKAMAMVKHATIVVGNIIYRDIDKYLETVPP
jgi:phosphoglycerol geranylgeranyltransferase